MVTVLFADIVDSTGLARRLDPERSRELLGAFFDAAAEELQALRGRPEKFIGDAVMAVFGLPQVHEDDALRAIRAGLAIRGRTRRLAADAGLEEGLQVRVGVESGEAATGVGPAGQLLVTGAVVNAAARLQTAALPGQGLAGDGALGLIADAGHLIRVAGECDIAAVLELWRESRSLAARTPDTPEALQAALDSLLVAEEEGRIVGTLIAAWDGWRGNMYRLAVVPDKRREGIAIALVRAGEELLRSHGARRITALVGDGEAPAESLWAAAGYGRDEEVARYVRNV